MKYVAAKAKLAIAAFWFVPVPALAADQPTLDTRQIMAGTVTTGGTAYKAYLAGSKDTTTAFKGARAQVVKLYFHTCPDGSILRNGVNCPVAPPPPPPPVLCPDGTTVPAGQTCPTPPPPPPPTPQPGVAAYGEIVTAVQACVGSYIPDALIVGARYRVLGNNAGYRPAPGLDPTVASGYKLNPETDDGLHRGDGYFGLWVPYACVQRAPLAAARRLTAAPQEPLPKLTATTPIRTAIETCRVRTDEAIMRRTGIEPVKYALVVKGQRYGVTASRNPGFVYAIPMTKGLGVAEVRANCF